MIEGHFLHLLACVRDLEGLNHPGSFWRGSDPRRWLVSALGPEAPAIVGPCHDLLHAGSLDRGQLAMRIDPRRADARADEAVLKALVLEILAWGMMSPRNTRLALPAWDQWKHVCAALLEGMPAAEAYARFHGLRARGALPGMGPAYFTKLVAFLGRGDGLVMDQWTARSMNLLFGPFIALVQNRYVADRNDADVYGAYLRLMAELATALSTARGKATTAWEAEEFIFSISPARRMRPPGMTEAQHAIASGWRRHVMRNGGTPVPEKVAP